MGVVSEDDLSVAPARQSPPPPLTSTPLPPVPAPRPVDTSLAIQTRGLRKSFGRNAAVRGLDLAVPTGSFFGLLGPNGAGKTTTLRMVTGLLRPDAGDIHVEGLPVWPSTIEVKRRLGVLAEDPVLFERLTGRELLTYIGLLRGIEASVVEERAGTLLAITGLEDDANVLVVDYSQGMRKKIGLAAALMHGPRILVLDEPFESVDPVSARTLRAILDRHRENGGTIVFSSHVMELVERLCDHVAIVVEGRVVAAGTLDDVRRGETLEDRFIGLAGGSAMDTGGLAWLGSSSD